MTTKMSGERTFVEPFAGGVAVRTPAMIRAGWAGLPRSQGTGRAWIAEIAGETEREPSDES